VGNAFVGIDLGTRYSILACVDDDGSKVIKNRWGRERTPSFVACDRGSLWRERMLCPLPVLSAKILL